MTPRKQITAQRRAKQAAKRLSAGRKGPGKKSTGAKAPVSTASNTLGSKPPPPSNTHLVQIEKPLYGGSFLARLEGKAVFVPLTLPGEQVRVRIAQSKSGYATAEAEEILSAAPQRIHPACTHFGACGGCHYQHTDYASQLAFKQAILRETLLRGGVDAPEEVAVLSGEQWGYRNRIRLALDAAGNPGYRGRRSHAVVPIRECPIAAPLLVSAALAFAEVARRFSPALRPTEIALFCNPAETALLAAVFTESLPKLRFDDFTQALAERIPALIGAEWVVEGGCAMGRNLAQLPRRRLRLSRRSRRLFPGQSLAGRCSGRERRSRSPRQAGLGLVRRRRPLRATACGSL
jgi:predicted RNA-binding protein with TRAM domain